MSRHKRYAHGGSAKTITHSQIRVEGDERTPSSSGQTPISLSSPSTVFELTASFTSSTSSVSSSSSSSLVAKVEPNEDGELLRLAKDWTTAPLTSLLDTRYHDMIHKLQERRETRRYAPYSRPNRPSKLPHSLQAKAHLQSEHLRGLVVARILCWWAMDELDYDFSGPLFQLALGTHSFSDATPKVVDMVESLPDPNLRSHVSSSSRSLSSSSSSRSSHSSSPEALAILLLHKTSYRFPSPSRTNSPLGLLPTTLAEMLEFAPFRLPYETRQLIDNPELPAQVPADSGHMYWQTMRL